MSVILLCIGLLRRGVVRECCLTVYCSIDKRHGT